MKRLLVVLLSATMVMGLSITAFAADPTTGDVVVEVEKTDDITHVYQETITWGNLDFKYTFDSTNDVWDPSTHTYSNKSTTATGWDHTSADIQIDNHANAKVDYAFAASATTTKGVSVAIDNSSFELASAVDTEVSAPPTNKATVKISGTPSTETEFTHSTITITITHPED